MHHGTHVRLVNPHAEGNRRHQHVRRTCQKLILNQPPRLRGHARMVGLDGETGFSQFVGKVFRIFAGPRVHHGRTAASLFQQFNQPRGFILILQRFHLAEDIRTVRRSRKIHSSLTPNRPARSRHTCSVAVAVNAMTLRNPCFLKKTGSPR